VAVAGVVAFAAGFPAAADSWIYAKERTDEEFVFGGTTIVRTIDARRDQVYPDFFVSVYRGKTLLATFRDTSFDQLFASEGHEFFVGISNSGLPGTAIILFDADGGLISRIDHSQSLLEYCEESITLIRQWYSDDTPSVRIELRESDGQTDIARITLTACDGDTITLSDVIDTDLRRHSERRGDGESNGQ
jgi:hypothetical protein